MELEATDIVSNITGGRPYCFVIMHYENMQWFYNRIRDLVEECGMACVKAEDVPPQFYMLDKIHELIRRAKFVIAEVSVDRPNVYYEIGYAIAKGKSFLLVKSRQAEVHNDLKGLETIDYDTASMSSGDFDRQIKEHIRTRLAADIVLLQGMILPQNPYPAYIVCSPKWPTADSVRPRARRTFGDYLGLVGIIKAYGGILGTDRAPEIIGGKDVDDQVPRDDASLFLIGSPKANDITAGFLERIQNGRGPNIVFLNDSGGTDSGYWLQRRDTGWMPEKSRPDARFEDWGLLLRGPHPDYPDSRRIVMIMAGQHSLGTGAACLAATDPGLISKIENQTDIDIRDKSQSFWVLVRALESTKDRHVDPEDVEIVDGGLYPA